MDQTRRTTLINDLGRLGIDPKTAQDAINNCVQTMVVKSAEYSFGFALLAGIVGSRLGVNGAVGGAIAGYIGGLKEGMSLTADSPACGPDGWNADAQQRLREEARSWAKPINQIKDSGIIR